MTKVKGKKLNIAINSNPHPNPLPEGEGVSPDGWVETTLGEVVEITMGQSPKGESYNENKDGLPFYQGVTEFNEKYVSIKKYTNQPTKIVQENTILFSVRAPVGRVNFVKWEACIGRGNAGLVMKNDNQDFLYFLLKFLERQIQNRTSGTVFTSISGKELKEIPIAIPKNPEEQKAIAGVLSAFDDKIELLREQNETLEKIGQEIFKEWFGKYKVGDKLPSGWRVGKIKDFGNVVCGKTPSKNDKENFGGNIPFIKIPDMHGKMFILNTTDTLSGIGSDMQKNKILPVNSICVSCIATVGLVTITTKESQTNQQINSIVPKKKFYTEYLYFYMKKLKKYLIDIGSGGTATLNVNTGTFSKIEILFPNNKSLKDFSEKTRVLFEKIKNNSEQIQTLSKTRDTLLPKLMKGEIILN